MSRYGYCTLNTADLYASHFVLRIRNSREGSRTNGRWLGVWRKNEVETVAGIFFAMVVVAAIFAPWIAPFDPEKVDIPSRLIAPSTSHWFGTDEFGRDILSRVIYGGRPV